MVSEDLLRKLYVKKSLKNVEGGFSLELMNHLTNATIIRPAKVSVGSEKYKDFSIQVGEHTIKNKSVSETNPVNFTVQSKVTITIPRDSPLPAEKYRIKFSLLSQEFGELKFSVKDQIR